MIASGCSIGTVIPQAPDDVLREWEPQAFGRSRSPRIVDPIVEPLWIGERVLVRHRHGAPADAVRTDPARAATDPDAALADLLDAVGRAVRTASATLDGYLTRQASRSPEGLIAGLETPERQGIGRRLLLGDSRGRQEAERRERVRKAGEALDAEGLPLVFVAVDLLELDGEPLLETPLLERKRHLDAIVSESELVRIGQFVRGPAVRWYPTWRAMGFLEMTLKAANSRYRPGQPSDEWAIAAIPRR